MTIKLLPVPQVQITTLPAGALLQAYAGAGAYTDCFSVKLACSATLAEFMAAFYTTPVFKLERWLLMHLLRHPSTDEGALALAQGRVSKFSAWHVEAREADQAILAAGRTRSWLMVASGSPQPGEVTTLFFGSAVTPRRRGGFGWQFSALLGFHKLYSRILLGAAARRLAGSAA